MRRSSGVRFPINCLFAEKNWSRWSVRTGAVPIGPGFLQPLASFPSGTKFAYMRTLFPLKNTSLMCMATEADFLRKAESRFWCGAGIFRPRTEEIGSTENA